MKPKIALFRIWSSPPIARSAADLLRSSFPEHEVQIFDFATLIKSDMLELLLNTLSVVRHYGLGILTGKWEFRIMFWRTPRIFRWMKSRAETILMRTNYHFSFQLGSLFDASLAGVPHFVYTDHTHLENLSYDVFEPAQLAAPAWIDLEKTVYANATKIFTRSTNINRSLIEQYGCPAARISQVYMGGNVPVVEEPMRNEGYANQNILFVGGDWERKGGPDLVAAFDEVVRALPNARLTIVGCTPPVEGSNLRVVGTVPVSEVYAYFLQASVFCLPTRLEPFGAVFVEAMAYRLPIVATAVGAIPDFVLPDRNGYLVEPGDIGALASALIELLSSPQKCREFGAKSSQLAKERYNWGTVGKLIRAEVDSILEA